MKITDRFFGDLDPKGPNTIRALGMRIVAGGAEAHADMLAVLQLHGTQRHHRLAGLKTRCDPSRLFRQGRHRHGAAMNGRARSVEDIDRGTVVAIHQRAEGDQNAGGRGRRM